VVQVSRSPYGKYTTIHPMHLLQVDVNDVSAWPLVNLHDVSLTHHSTNGIYNYTAVRLDFAGLICNITIRGQQASVDWANRLLAHRRKVLELLSMGLLEAEDHYDLIPPSQLTLGQPPADKQARKKSLIWFGAFGGVGALLAAIAIPYNAGAADRSEWQSVSAYASLASYRRYLERFPSGAHMREARAGMGRLYDEAIEKYKERAIPADNERGRQAIIDVINALRASDSPSVHVSYKPEIHFENVAALMKVEEGVTSPEPAFTSTQNSSRESAITSALDKAFSEVVSHDVLELSQYNSNSPITFAVQYKVSPSGSLYESTTGPKKKLLGILVDWDFTILVAGEEQPRYHLQMTSSPAKHIGYTSSGYEDSDILPYTKMAESAFDEFGRKLAGEFGVKLPVPSDSDEDRPSASSILNGNKKFNDLTPSEKARVLEDLRRALQKGNYNQ
jgi:hypothetical protein